MNTPPFFFRVLGSISVLVVGATLHATGIAVAAPESPDDPVRADFNGDGFDDLAIGVPLADVGNVVDAGAVRLYAGGTSGLTFLSTLSQNSAFVADTAEAGDRFGSALTTGFFNADRFLDLAVGVPGEDRGRTKDSGAVHVFYGTAKGLTATGDVVFDQASRGIGGSAEAGDRFGSSVAAGDFGRTGQQDLAVGVPLEDVGKAKDAGIVQVIYGTTKGLASAKTKTISQNTSKVEGSAESGDRFGSSLAVGDFGRSAKDDLAIAAPYEDIQNAKDTGMVHVLYGATKGLTGSGSSAFGQANRAISGLHETGDLFGFSLSAGNLGRSAKDELAIGVPYEDIGTRVDAGLLHVLYGASGAMSAAGSEEFSADSPNVGGASEAGDHFGFALASADLIGTAESELVVGVPDEDFEFPGQDRPTMVDPGSVEVLLGSAPGLNRGGRSKELTAEAFEVSAQSEPGDRWGAALATGNFSTSPFGGGTKADLVIGEPGEDINRVTPAVPDVGEVSLLVGSDRDFQGNPGGDIVGKPEGDQLFVPTNQAKAGDRFGSAISSTRLN
ncbi:MAG TPA: FG-GAP repeat protein [Microlunatus sp.]